MTLAEIRQAVRDLSKEWETDAGTLFPADNVLLDSYINWAIEQVVLDLAQYLPDIFLDYEDISLVASQSEYGLTKEFLQIYAIQVMKPSEYSRLLPFMDVIKLGARVETNKTSTEPEYWYLKGNKIVLAPTPSLNRDNYLRVWIIKPEPLLTEDEDSPEMIPRVAQKLIPIQTCILAAAMNEIPATNYETLYVRLLERTINIFAYRVQQQPRFINESSEELIQRKTGGRTGFDPFWE